MSLRLAVAKDEGLDEVMAAKVDRYEASDLPDRQRPRSAWPMRS